MWYLKSAFNAYKKVQESVHSGLQGFILDSRADNQMQRKRSAELETHVKKPPQVKAPQSSGLKPRRST